MIHASRCWIFEQKVKNPIGNNSGSSHDNSSVLPRPGFRAAILSPASPTFHSRWRIKFGSQFKLALLCKIYWTFARCDRGHTELLFQLLNVNFLNRTR